MPSNDTAIINDAAASTPAPPAPAPAADSTDSLVDEIERLADLRDRGIITEDDFQVAKNNLLGLWPILGSEGPATLVIAFLAIVYFRIHRRRRQRGARDTPPGYR